MSSKLRQPSRIAEYSAEGSYYPRELVEVNGELYIFNTDGTKTRVNPSGVTSFQDASGVEIGSIDPTLTDTIVIPDASASQSGFVKFSTSAPKANGTATAGSDGAAARADHVHPLQTDVSGNAGTATKLESGNTIALSGAATGTATNFDGSKAITIPVTTLDATKLSGIVPLACIPKGALERLVITASDTTRFALTSDNVQLGDVIKVENTGMMYYVVDESKLGTEDAFEIFTAGTASAVAWTNVTDKPNFAAVATSGKYNDLEGAPSIPVASSSAGSALGTASAGTSAEYARADHVHPIQTTVSGNAGTATKLETSVKIGLSGVTATAQEFDGSKTITIPITAVPVSIVTGLSGVATSGSYDDLSNKPSIPAASSTTPKIASGSGTVGTGTTWARADHVHPVQTSVSGNAGTATKLAAGVNIGLSGVTATAQEFDGSKAITIPITAVPASIVTDLADVAKTGKYEDLTGTPSIPVASTVAPSANGTAAVGTSAAYARADHVHPVPTVVGNATSASKAEKLANPVNIGLSGVTATAQEFDGTSDVTIPITAVPASIVTDLADVAKTGKYEDLTGTPSIPAASSTTPKAAGTAAVGTGTTWARADHVHPAQTTITGEAGSAAKLATTHSINLSGVTAEAQSFNGTQDVVIPIAAVPASIVTGLATVATSGKYEDLTGTPSIPVASSTTPAALGTAAVGTATTWARADHVHAAPTSVSGNAGTATKLAAGVNIGLSGVTATAQEFDGSKAITIPITAVPASIVTGLADVAISGSYDDLSDTPTIPAASSTAAKAAGTAAVGTSANYARADHVHPLQTTITGNAGTATKLASGNTIALSGAATGTATNFDGSVPITIPVTTLDATKLSGTIPIDCIPKGALERLVITASDTTRLALTSSSIQSGDVVKVESTGLMYYVKDDTKLGTEDAFEAFTAGTASAVAWTNVTGKPTFAAVSTSGSYNDLSNKPTIPSASSTAPAALGTAAVGTSTEYARADHVHAAPTSVSGNAGTATKLAAGVNIGLSGVTATAQEFDGSKAITIPITAVPASIVTGLATVATSGSYDDLSNKPSIPAASSTIPAALGTAAVGTATTWARADHVHPLQTTITGNAATATTADKVANAMTIKLNGGTTEGTNLFTYNGSGAKSINITPDSIGAAASSHGTHVTYSTTSPKAAGTAAVGSENAVARGDHVHPLQTTVSGNAGTATKFADAQSVALTGDVTGSASSQAGWSVATTLADSGVTAGNYGPSANADPGSAGTFSVPYMTVDAKGRVTAASIKTITMPTVSKTYSASIGTTWTGSAAPYTQTISVSGITADDNPIVDVVLSGTYATDETALVEYAKIYRITTAANSITVYASDKTTAVLGIQLKCIKE